MNTNIPILKVPHSVGDGVAYIAWTMPRKSNFLTKMYVSQEENGTYTLYKTLPSGLFFSEVAGETNLWVYVTSVDEESNEESAASNKVQVKIVVGKQATNQDVALLSSTSHKKIAGVSVAASVVNDWYSVLDMNNLAFHRKLYAMSVAVTGSVTAEMRILSRKDDAAAFEVCMVADLFWDSGSDTSPKLLEFAIPAQFVPGSDVRVEMRTTDTAGTFEVLAAYVVDYSL